jgi:hypothetical protein
LMVSSALGWSQSIPTECMTSPIPAQCSALISQVPYTNVTESSGPAQSLEISQSIPPECMTSPIPPQCSAIFTSAACPGGENCPQQSLSQPAPSVHVPPATSTEEVPKAATVTCTEEGPCAARSESYSLPAQLQPTSGPAQSNGVERTRLMKSLLMSAVIGLVLF